MSDISPTRPGRRPAPRRAWVIATLAAIFAAPMGARADDLTDSIFAINNALLSATRLTSSLLVAGPPEVAREIAIVDSAMYDAANAASGGRYAGFAYTGPVTGASADIAALAAGYTALNGIFGNSVWQGVPVTSGGNTTLIGGSTTIQTQVLSNIQATYNTALTNLLSAGGGSSLTISQALGQAAGTANLTANGYILGSDGLVTTAPDTGPGGSYTQIAAGITNPYVPANSNPGTYVPISTNPSAAAPASSRVAMFPTWGTVTPTGSASVAAAVHTAEAAVPAPPAISSAAYAANLLQTECEGGGTPIAPASALGLACASAGFAASTSAQTAALFWNDPGSTVQPPGHWLQIADTLATGMSTADAAHLGALLGIAMDDAGIGAWDIKYANVLWRPVTAIRDCSTAQGAQPGVVSWSNPFTACSTTWSALIATPPHPDYLAGHPAFSGAAVTVLDHFLGTDSVTFQSTSDAYCNGANTLRDPATLLVNACTSTTGRFAFSDGTTTFPTFYGSDAACATAGTRGTFYDPALPQTLKTCVIAGVTYVFNPASSASGCDDLVTGGSNDSPLICPITETFNSISDAATGPNGSENSRIAGGIHTPIAVTEANILGDTIGTAVVQAYDVPEPATGGVFLTALLLIAATRFKLTRMNRPARPAASPTPVCYSRWT
jgi:hypothetical protein